MDGLPPCTSLWSPPCPCCSGSGDTDPTLQEHVPRAEPGLRLHSRKPAPRFETPIQIRFVFAPVFSVGVLIDLHTLYVKIRQNSILFEDFHSRRESQFIRLIGTTWR